MRQYTENSFPLDEPLRRPAPITAHDVARILRRRSPIIIAVFVLVCVAVTMATKKMRRVYETKASVLLDTPSSGNGIDMLSFMGHSGAAALDTEIAKIQSRTFILKIIHDADLKDAQVEDVRGRITLTPGPQILEIGTRASTAEEAQRIANTVADDYIAFVKTEFAEKTKWSEQRLTAARDDAFQAKLKAEAELHKFTASMGNSDPALIFTNEASRTVGASTALTDSLRNLPLQQAQLANLQAQLKTIPPTVITGTSFDKNGEINALTSQITDLQVQRKDKLFDYAPDSDEIKAIDEQIATRQVQLDDLKKDPYSVGSKGVARNPDYSKVQSQIWDAQIGLINAKQSIASLQKQVGTLESEQKRLSPLKVTYEQLQHARDDANDAYEKARNGLLQLDLAKLTSIPYIRVLDYAQLPPNPISPKPLLNGIMAVALGLILGVAAALMAEYVAGGFAPPDEETLIRNLPEVGGIPLLGSLPIALPAPLTVVGGDRDLPVPLHAMATRGAAIEDALREIGYCLTHRANDNDPAPVVLLTSVRGDDSTATLAAQLTATLVRDGLRVTLVDADRDQPRLNRFFGAPDAPGLADVLAGRTSLKDAVYTGANGALRFLAAGSPEDRAAPTEEKLRSVFKNLTAGDSTDIVFVSGPAVWNARRIAPLEKAAHGMVLLTFTDASGGGSPDESVARVRRLLSNGYKPDILGVIVGQTEATALSMLPANVSSSLTEMSDADDFEKGYHP